MPASAPLPAIALASGPSPIEELQNLRRALGGGPRLLIKRDDTLSFAFGGNKVRKMQLVAADALKQHADTLITSGGVQSNHARVTAAAAAKLGMRSILVANGAPPEKPSGNALLDRLLGAEVRYVARREDRAPAMEEAAEEMRRAGRRPYVIPIGASTPLGAAAFVQAVDEMLAQLPAPPDVIVHSTSSGGTQAGLIVGCALAKIQTQVIGISADEPAAILSDEIANIAGGLYGLLEPPPAPSASSAGVHESWHEIRVAVDDRFVGGGYGVPTTESQEAIELLARTEAIFLDPTYTAKAMAGLIARVREGDFTENQTVLFWHTGGQVALFA
jgi:D-cysteine desulfhydrase family pyridoxal phosphate-dependent enzyme